MTIQIIKNGKRVFLPDDVATYAEAREHLGIAPTDVIMRQQGAKFDRVKPEDLVQPNDRIVPVGEVSKGTVPEPFRQRVEEELALLRQTLGQRSPVGERWIERGGQPFLAVEIRQIQLDRDKFKGGYANLLLLLPADYPVTPPIGFYLNYPYPTTGEADHHFHRRTYYGAPDLQQNGWYWYCLQPMHATVWRPAVQVSDGHSLVSLLAAATYALNT